MVSLQALEDPEEAAFVRGLLERHLEATGSDYARRILLDWERSRAKFVCVVPHDYARMMNLLKEMERAGLSGEAARDGGFRGQQPRCGAR